MGWLRGAVRLGRMGLALVSTQRPRLYDETNDLVSSHHIVKTLIINDELNLKTVSVLVNMRKRSLKRKRTQYGGWIQHFVTGADRAQTDT